MDYATIVKEMVGQREKQERRKFRDRCAIAAMQSLIQVSSVIDKEGWSQSTDEVFMSMAGEAMQDGFRYISKERHVSLASEIAGQAYAIAKAMLLERDEQDYIEDEDEYENAKETKEAASTEDAGRVHDDGGSVLDVHSLQSSPDVSQVGSPQAHSGDVQATEPE